MFPGIIFNDGERVNHQGAVRFLSLAVEPWLAILVDPINRNLWVSREDPR
jgi:hypothetical protein